MSMKSLLVMVIFGLLIASSVYARTPSPKEAQVYIISPEDGAIVSSPVKVVFGLSGMGVAPAGIDKANTGHHHLLVDVAERPAPDKPLPADDRHKHFGGGQTETMLELPSGKHTLQLIMGDQNHVPHDPPVISQKVTITVK